MKINVNQKNLKKAVAIVEKIVSKNASLPILQNILLKTDNGRLKISATNLEIGINYIIGSKVEEVGEIAVPARIFSDFINNVTDEKVTLQTKNNILNINSDTYKTKILGLDPKDFPIIPKIKNKPIAVVQARILKNSILSVFDSVAVSETRPELSGVFTLFDSKKIVFAATDSFRLSERSIEVKNYGNASFIIPRNTAVEIIRICGELEGEINIILGDNQVSFSNDDFELVSRLIDGNYPDYKKVIPDKFIAKALISKNDLDKSIRLAGLFSSNVADIKIQCSEKKTTIIAKNSERGEVEAAVESVLKNEPFEISLNYHYLLDGLKAVDSENVVIEFTGVGSPLVIRQEDALKNFVYLIMPLRT